MLNGFYQALDLNLSDNLRDNILLAQEEAKTLKMIPFGTPTKERKLTYFEEQKQEHSSAIVGAFADAVTLGPIAVSDEFGTVLFKNYVVQVEDEQMIVDVVVKTLGAMTFTVKARGQAGTTAVAHIATSPIVITGMAEPEGIVSNSYAMGDRIERQNFFQEITTNIQLTKRAIEQSTRDRDDLYGEEKVRRFRKHIQQLDSVARVGRKSYDPVEGQHTIGGYEQLIAEYGGQTQATLGYANGAFNLTDWNNLLMECYKRNSSANVIHTNAQTKLKILSLLPDVQRVSGKDNTSSANYGLPFADGVTTPQRDGRILTFYVDDKISGSQFNLVNFSKMMLVPRTAMEGGSKVFMLADEPTNSAVISETLRSEMSLELTNGVEMAVCKNV